MRAMNNHYKQYHSNCHNKHCVVVPLASTSIINQKPSPPFFLGTHPCPNVWQPRGYVGSLPPFMAGMVLIRLNQSEHTILLITKF